MVENANAINNMTTGATKYIEARWKLDWDYLGYTGLTNSFNFDQKGWDQTLITKINQISTEIHKKSQLNRNLGNTLKMHPIIFAIVRGFEYFRENIDGSYSISDRYKITVDESLPIDKLYVINDDYSMFIGEITILNHRRTLINPQTGIIEFTPIQQFVQNTQEYFIPQPKRTQEDVDKLIENSRRLVIPEKMPKQIDKSLLENYTDEDRDEMITESRILRHNINEEPKKVYTIPVGEHMSDEQARTFLQKITNLFKTGKYE